MKRTLSVVAALLAALLLLSCAAFAAPAVPVITEAEGADVVVQTGGEKLDVTYSSNKIAAGGLYMIFLVKADEEGQYIPTESSVLYIGQTQAAEAGKVVFSDIYPSEMVDCAVMISGTGLTGPVVVATIELPYILGDVNEDDEITSLDAVLLLQYSVGLTELNENQLIAADVTGDGRINSSDAIQILKMSVGLITEWNQQ